MVRLAKRRLLTAVIAGVIVATLIVTGTFVYAQLSRVPAGSVTLNGVFVNVTYVPGSLKPWPASTSNCTDRPFGLPSYHCPLNLSGGTELGLLAFLPVPRGDWAYFNDTIWSPVPFHEPSCTDTGPGPCPLTNLWEDYNASVEGGYQWGDVVTLTVPSPAPSFDHGFWVIANVTVDVVSG